MIMKIRKEKKIAMEMCILPFMPILLYASLVPRYLVLVPNPVPGTTLLCMYRYHTRTYRHHVHTGTQGVISLPLFKSSSRMKTERY